MVLTLRASSFNLIPMVIVAVINMQAKRASFVRSSTSDCMSLACETPNETGRHSTSTIDRGSGQRSGSCRHSWVTSERHYRE